MCVNHILLYIFTGAIADPLFSEEAVIGLIICLLAVYLNRM